MQYRNVLNMINFVHAIKCHEFECLPVELSDLYETLSSLSHPRNTHSQGGDYIADRGIILRQTALLYIYPRSKEADSKGDTWRSQSVRLQIRFTRHEPPSPSGENRVGSSSLSCTYFT